VNAGKSLPTLDQFPPAFKAIVLYESDPMVEFGLPFESVAFTKENGVELHGYVGWLERGLARWKSKRGEQLAMEESAACAVCWNVDSDDDTGGISRQQRRPRRVSSGYMEQRWTAGR
jgi:hypothetical protein